MNFFHDGCSYHTETSLLIRRANQWPGFYKTRNPLRKSYLTHNDHADNYATSLSRKNSIYQNYIIF